MSYAYSSIVDFSPDINNISDDPLTYCAVDFLNAQFMHGGQARTFGKYNRNCAEFMSSRCAQNWDQVCEAASLDNNVSFPEMINNPGGGEESCCELNAGEILVRNTAYKRYLISAKNCNFQCQPFDPTVADSPMICSESRSACSTNSNSTCVMTDLQGKVVPPHDMVCKDDYQGGPCVRHYGITNAQLKTLDDDPVMNRLLYKPQIAPVLLELIYYGMKQDGRLSLLKNTRLGYFYLLNKMSLE